MTIHVVTGYSLEAFGDTVARRRIKREQVYGQRRSTQSATNIVGAWTREEMGIASIKELDEQERSVFRAMVEMIAGGGYDASWSGPHAKWLAMIGRRPLYVNHDVGTGNYTRRSRARHWRDLV